MSQTTPPSWPPNCDWTPLLTPHFQSPSFQTLIEFVNSERASQVIYPQPENVFNAFKLTSFKNTKVVILGQDPYHGPSQAHGLSFSVEDEMKLPPSLRNIYKELATDLQCELPTSGNLTAWAQQGVFLLNTVLTVRKGEANSHRKQGWEKFTDEVISQMNQHPAGIVFILWGKPAEKKLKLIDQDRHGVLIAPHPSPLSAHRGFFGSRPFSQANLELKKLGRTPLKWLA
ncbi:MAG: uracil-DNA glycosylase [Mariniblastus sp.]|jgi:uracil-DNA glycosylase